MCDFGKLWEPNRDGESTKNRSEKTSKLELFFEYVFSSFWSPFGMHVGGQIGEKTSAGREGGREDGRAGGATVRFHEICWYFLQVGFVFVTKSTKKLRFCVGFWWAEF